MAPTKVILLACGSYNPPTNMHLRMFEIARDHLHRMGQYLVIGGLVSPVHDAYGKKELVTSSHRLGMIKLALENHDWVKLSDWECQQESWSRTRQVLQYHQNHVNALLHAANNQNDFNNDMHHWMPENMENGNCEQVRIKLLCGADLLESFGTPGLWADEDIEAIVGHHGLVVITRAKSNPLKFIYNSDLLTKYMANITIVTEWIENEISSTKIRRALRRSESVKYLLPDKVIDYIHKHNLYGSEKIKYLSPNSYASVFLTPSPTDTNMESPSPTKCMFICNNNLFSRSTNYDKRMSIDTVDSFSKSSLLNMKHPGQAVKIVTENTGEHKILKNSEFKNCNEVDLKKEVSKATEESGRMKMSKSCTNFKEVQVKGTLKNSRSNANLKECKSCDENLIKFIFTKHGIQVISDVETIV